MVRAEPPGPTALQALHSPPSWTRGAGSHPGARHSSCSGSAIALISDNLQECSSNGITWNCFFFFLGGGLNKHSFLWQVSGKVGQLCVGVVFFFCFFVPCFLIMFTICLNHFVFYKDSTSSPRPHPLAFEAVRKCLKNSTKSQFKSNFAHIYIYIQKRNISVIYNKEHYFLMKNMT